MDPIHAKIHKASREVKMDPHLRDGFRRTLEVMASGHVARTPARLFSVPRSFAWASAAVLVAVSGASVTLASTRSVPGDPLYPAKVSVLEPVERALAFSEEAKGQVAVSHLERRFREAAELTAQGTYDEHDEELAELAKRDRDVLDGDVHAAARAKFESVAAAYAPVLRAKGSQRFAFAAAVRLGSFEDDEVSDELRERAAREQLARVKRSQESTASERFRARMREADRLAAAAEAELERRSFKSALELSGAAAQIANEAELFASLSATSSTSTAATSSTSTAATTSTASSSQSLFQLLFPGN
jgi:hypothetical protein